jgi:hypothetical protein
MPGEPEKVSNRKFHLEEYKALRSEIIAQGAKYDQMKIILIGGLGALYSWMFSNLIVIDRQGSCIKLDMISTTVIVIIPVLVSSAVWLFAVFIIYGIEKAGAYIRRLKDYLGDPNLGWEKFAFERELVDSRASVKQIRLFSTRDRLWVLI